MKKTLNNILNLDVFIAGISLVILVIITFLGSIMRYFFNSPFIWQEEVQLGLIVWVVFFGASFVFRQGNHIAIDIIVDTLPKKIAKAIEVLIYIVTICVLFFFMINSNNLVQQFIRTNKETNILHIPSQFIYMAIPIGCALMIINYTVKSYYSFFSKDIDKDEAEKEGVQ